jgi:hypothetical protein
LNAFLVSAVCHLGALVGLGLVVMSAGPSRSDVRLLAHLGERYDEPVGGDATVQDHLPEFTVTQAAAAITAGPVKVFDTSTATSSAPDFVALEASFDELDAGGGLDSRALTEVGDDRASGSPAGAEFFGVSGYGGKFVYVVDVSGSMGEGGKYIRVRKELLRSIEHLREDQRYFVILYSDASFPMDASEPILATPEHINATRRWVHRVWPDGGTFPLQSLLLALRLEPDAIYFLSDGKFDPAVIDAVRIQNPPSSGQIPIHTIAFVNKDTVGIMRAIADNSGGTFRFVP